MFIKIINLVYAVLVETKHYWIILSLVSAFVWGYGIAHSEVATECKKLNSFYVGENVYDCKVRANND